MNSLLKLAATFAFSLGLIQLHAQTKQIIGKPITNGARITTQFKGDKLTVYRNDGYAIINLAGETICSGIKAPRKGFSEYFSIDHEVFFAEENATIVLKDLTGKNLGNLTLEKFQPFITTNTLVQLKGTDPSNSSFAYIDNSGKELIRFDKKKYLSATTGNTASFSSGDGFIAGTLFLSAYDFPPYSEGLTAIQNYAEKKFGFVDQQFKLAIPAKFKAVSRFSDGLAAVQNDDGNWGYIDKTGKLVIPFNYSIRPADFSSDLAKLKSKTGLYGFINKNNELVIETKYEYATNFYKGKALVRESYNSAISLIDSTGNVISTFPKDCAYIDESDEPTGISGGNKGEKPYYISATLQQLVDYGKGIFKKGMSCGLVDMNGNIILDFKYALLSDYHEGKMFAHLAEFIDGSTQHTYGIIDDEGQLLLQLVDSQF